MTDMTAAKAFEIAKKYSDELKKTASKLDSELEYPHAEMQALKRSGLGLAAVPRQYGGWGIGYADMVEIIRIIAKGNMSIAQMFSTSHTICIQEFNALLPPETGARILSRIGAEKLLIGNATAERHTKDVMSYNTTFTPTKDGAGVSVTGEKFFCTGSPSADLLYMLGILDGGFAMLLLDPKSPGVDMRGDWRAMGQRGTGSGTISFKDVYVANEFVARDIVNFDAPNVYNIFAPINQGYMSAIVVGGARAAFEAAIEYINKYTRPWIGSGVTNGAEDPYILAKAGELASLLGAAEAQLRDMCISVEAAIAARATGASETAMAEARALAMTKVAETKVFSTEAGLRVTSDIFQMCGARSAMAEINLDRYWRDIRTFTLHDPVTYKMKSVGEYHILGRQPYPTFFG